MTLTYIMSSSRDNLKIPIYIKNTNQMIKALFNIFPIH